MSLNRVSVSSEDVRKHVSRDKTDGYKLRQRLRSHKSQKTTLYRHGEKKSMSTLCNVRQINELQQQGDTSGSSPISRDEESEATLSTNSLTPTHLHEEAGVQAFLLKWPVRFCRKTLLYMHVTLTWGSSGTYECRMSSDRPINSLNQ